MPGIFIWSSRGRNGPSVDLTRGVQMFPRISPDGKYIAFTGQYDGKNTEVFVIPVEGGEPRRLTYNGHVETG